MRRGRGGLLRATVLVGAVAALAACGGGGSPGGLPQASSEPAPSSTAGSTATSSATSSSAGSATSATVGRGRPIADGVVVATPSGNILCVGSGETAASPGHALCWVVEHDYVIPSCESQPGATFSVSADDRRGSLGGCLSDVFTQRPVPVSYGDALRLGPIVCDVADTGVTCTNDDGHGFWVSRREYRLF